jgi:predicted DNA-binding helix-hairpin-helix protein
MDLIDRLRTLSSEMELEPAEDTGCPKLPSHRHDDIVVSRAVLPDGRRISLLKTLLSSACERDCLYCPFRAGRDFRRATFKPDELAESFMALHQAGGVDGLFLSSGVIGGGVRTQDLLLDSADILRHQYRYRGYLHLKIMPGAERGQVERAMELADRVSVNLEAPNPTRLLGLAPGKVFQDELVRPLRWVEEIRRTRPAHRAWNGRWPSSTTQFVVGAMGESDLELLSTSEQLYRQTGLARAYYSPFRPVPDTPLEDNPPTPLEREHRLYQASFLLRDYGFSVEDLPFTSGGDLPLDVDPKLAWARSHLADQPVEVNRAGREELLRVPGIGPKGAEAILGARGLGRLKGLSSLRRLGILPHRAAPYVLIDGARPARQLPLL